ncbi:hypothetical protein LCGC14_1331780 [marine sediment metagenome]|uniref:RecA family profile 2 domain-containing protein n=1 Tax=marine sediment metagenome TaxID=412755 RepID=A0A0F9L2A5_9ZZZZ
MAKRQLVHTPDKQTERDEQTAGYVAAVKQQGRPRPDPKEVEAAINTPIDKDMIVNAGDFERGVISSGSTLLDLAISSNRVRGGGIPAGVIIEIFGPPSSGKTAVLADIGASAKFHGGVVKYGDPEARLDTAYARKCGLILTKSEYYRPDTVEELEDSLLKWKPKPPDETAICVRCEDSLAAFSTEKELSKEGHKMGAAKRAQAFHVLFRKLGRKISKEGWVVACSNQEQDSFGGQGKTTPGGNAIKYWSSLRIRIFPTWQKSEVTRRWTIVKGHEAIEKIVGMRSTCKIVKSSCDDPKREVPLFIIFGKGIDDIRGNLQWMKETLHLPQYDCVEKNYAQIDPAIRYIEDHNLEAALREKVIDLWDSIEDHFRIERKEKVRF